jgi:dipeptidyl aminopeptidase/acylaminoacyl peptidase
MKSVAAPQLSPDGRSIVYVYSWPDRNTDSYYSNLHLIVPGAKDRALTDGDYQDNTPSWSPDGKRLAYASDRGGRRQIHIYSLESKEDRVLAGTDGAAHLAWSPDGRWLAYMSFVASPAEWDPHVPLPPGGAKWAAPAVTVTSLRWTFDGQGILQPGGNRIFTISPEGGAAKQISAAPFQHTSYLTDPELTWSADSRSVISPAVKATDGWAVFNGNQLYAFPVSGGEPVQLTRGEGHKSAPQVSPDGKWLAYSGFDWKGQSYTVSQLRVVPAAGGEARILTPDWDRDVASPVWSADSDKLYFLSDDHGSVNVYMSDLRADFRQVTSGAYRLSGLSVRHGKAATLQSTAAQPNAVALFELDQPSKVIRTADPNAVWLAVCDLAPAEEIVYRSFDGKEVQGWLLKPRGFAAGRKYPLVVSMHGGPHGSYGPGFIQELQMLAQAGYVVLYTNPRGSTGYGEKFGNSIQRKWPGDDIKDVLAGVDSVLAKGFVDEKRMAVMGGSGGGLMTAWMIGQTDRFRAAVALYPVTNWFTHVGSDDNGVLIANLYRNGWPWEDPQDYMQHSPVFYARNFKTPTMVISGDEDWRVPVAQSQELFRALKVRGVDTVFVRIPGEAHGIGKYPSHRLAVWVHTLAWLARYVPLTP